MRTGRAAPRWRPGGVAHQPTLAFIGVYQPLSVFLGVPLLARPFSALLRSSAVLRFPFILFFVPFVFFVVKGPFAFLCGWRFLPQFSLPRTLVGAPL